MYQNLAPRARAVLKCAREEAKRLGHRHVGTEHLLLGLTADGGGLAIEVLTQAGLDLAELKQTVETILKGGTEVISSGSDYALTPRARTVLDYALEESESLGQHYIGTEHILLGLLREPEGIGGKVLMEAGLRTARARALVRRITGAGTTEDSEDAPPPPPRPSGAAMYELTVEDTFSAAHSLRDYKGKCEKLHGHNWRIRICVASSRIDERGMVVDFQDLKQWLAEIVGRLDHEHLNDVKPFNKLNPTTENMARYVAERIRGKLPGHVQVRRVTCWESDRCSASYVP
jgi:6-pyruvoyltetrahydropterin/6-carboxytetrahydropterin synthase